MKLLFVAAALLISACTSNAPSPTVPPVPTPTPKPVPPSPGPGGPGGPEGLEGRTFLSISFTRAGADRPLVANTRVRLDFRDAGRLGVGAGCNSMGAPYRIENGTLRTGEAASTAMGCEKELMSQDEWVFGLVTSAPSLLLDGNNLTLKQGDLVGTFMDVEVADPDLTLGNHVWTVTAILTGATGSSVPLDVVATLELKEDGGMLVATGCNTGLARPTIQGAEIAFGPISLTKKACAGAAGELERAVLAVLSADRVTWEIQARTLTLTAGANGLVLAAP
jgi:heat shock protein HslJ